MTIKEIIKRGNEKFPQDIIEIINDDGSITMEDVNFKIRKAYMEGLIDNNVPLPSNLDDAAEEWARSVYGNPGKSAVSISGAYGFKSGAKWLAGQGETQEHFVIEHTEESHGHPVIVCYPESFEIGDEVEVIILKKQ